jgi:hypothetical protein
MEQERFQLPAAPAGASPLLIDLYSEQHTDPAARNSLV